MSRPAGLVPQWASTANYPAGANPWSSTPTKVDPGTTLVAAGFVPSTKLPAQFMNWLLNQYSVWLDYQDTFEVHTWSEPTFPQGANHDLANLLQDNCACYEADNYKLFLAGQDQTDDTKPRILHSSNGEDWVDDGAPMTGTGSDQTYQLSYGPGHGLLCWISEGSGQVNARRGLDGAWASFTITTPQKTYAARWFVPLGGWVLVGEIGGSHPGVTTWIPAGTTGSTGATNTPTLPGASGITMSGVVAPLIAVSPSHVIVAAPSPASVDASTWVSSDGVTWSHVVVTGSGQPFAGLVWNDGDGLFYGVTDFGGNCKIYTSRDGSSWTLATTITGTWVFSRSRAEHSIDTSRAVVPMANIGSLVVASAQITTPDLTIIGVLVIGYNGGLNWDVIQQSNIVATEAGTSSSLSAIQQVDGRLITIRDDDAGQNRGTTVSYNLRLRP